jgi:hypothetical protein
MIFITIITTFSLGIVTEMRKLARLFTHNGLQISIGSHLTGDSGKVEKLGWGSDGVNPKGEDFSKGTINQSTYGDSHSLNDGKECLGSIR